MSVLGAPQPDPVSPQGDVERALHEENRDAILDALLALHLAGNLHPDAEQITEQAELEPGAIFLYFKNLEDLQHEAVSRHRNRMLPLVTIKPGPEAPLAERIAALIEQRMRLFEMYGSLGTVVSLNAPFQPLVKDELVRIRAFLGYQLKGLFAPELGAMSSDRAETAHLAIGVLCAFESYRLMHAELGLSVETVRKVLTTSVTTLLTSTEP